MKHQQFNQRWRFWNQIEPDMVRDVELPHDAMIHEKRIPNLAGGECSGYFPGGAYVYEKRLRIGEGEQEPTTILDFDGVYQKAVVYLNGEEVGRHLYGYTNFYVDISKKVQPGIDNVIRVEVDNTQTPNSRWYTGSGIYREVNILKGPKCYIVPDGVRIHTTSHEPAVVEIGIEVKGVNKKSGTDIVLEIQEHGGKPLPEQSVKISSMSKERKGDITYYTLEAAFESPRKWSAEDPYLYMAKIMLKEGDICLDEELVNFGIHQVTWSASQGLCGNGTELKLRGACIHHDNGLLGACEFKESAYRRIRILKETGYNAIRMAHHPPSRFLLQACDELGMYLMNELTDVWQESKNPYDYSMYFEAEWERDMETMVRTAYSHPSVVMYAIGNEVYDITKQVGIQIGQRMIAQLKEWDQTRPVLNCMHVLTASSKPGKKPLKPRRHTPEERVDPHRVGKPAPLVGSKLMNLAVIFLPKLALRVTAKKWEENMKMAMEGLDIVGMNYGIHLTKDGYCNNPDRLIVHSETYPSYIAKSWPAVKRYPNVIGDFMWTGWDYLGEAGIGVVQYGNERRRMNKPYPCISGGVGAVNLVGEIEAQGYYTKAVFGKLLRPYIGVRPLHHAGEKRLMSQWRGTDAVNSWSWDGCEGKTAQIEVYSSAHTVELWQDGESLGRKRVKEAVVLYETVYIPGQLTAKGYDEAGSCIGVSSLKTAAADTRIQLSSERTRLQSGGNDITYIQVSITDMDGTVKVLQDHLIKLQIEGCGVLQAVGSGSPITAETYVGSQFTTYYGRMAAVVRSTVARGAIRITASAEGLQSQTIIIEAD